jgi:hypothetical protein
MREMGVNKIFKKIYKIPKIFCLFEKLKIAKAR